MMHQPQPQNAGNWRGQDLAKRKNWCFELDDRDNLEIDSALSRLRDRKISWETMGREDFPLMKLAVKLAEIEKELEFGCGIARLKGLAVDKYGEDDLKRIWWGLGLYLGTARHQDYQGLLLREITDLNEDTDARMGHVMQTRTGERFISSKARTASNGPLRYHTDRCDVVGLLCVHPAQSGGQNRIASTAAVHDHILAQRPDLLALLYEAYPRSRLGEEGGGENSIYHLPIFGLCEGKLTSHYSRTYIEAAQEVPGATQLSDLQWEALELLQSSCDLLAMEMQLEPGDMQFLNNHMVYHARAAYQDSQMDNIPRRLLYRLWLSTPCSRRLPKDHQILWGDVRAGALRGGIFVEHL